MKTNYHSHFYQRNAPTSMRSARTVLAALREITAFGTVLDVGCGIGTWGRAAHELGVTRYRGLDGDYVRKAELLVAPEEFASQDLRQPFDLGERFDLAVCMEVAEHLPADCGGHLISSLCAHAPVVLFSAAIPRQGGVDHLNEQWQSYWVARFAEAGYGVFDCIRPRVWSSQEVAEYYKQNALVFVDRQNESLTRLFAADAAALGPLLDLVHPESYLIKSDPARWPLPVILRHLPAILARVLRNRLFSR